MSCPPPKRLRGEEYSSPWARQDVALRMGRRPPPRTEPRVDPEEGVGPASNSLTGADLLEEGCMTGGRWAGAVSGMIRS